MSGSKFNFALEHLLATVTSAYGIDWSTVDVVENVDTLRWYGVKFPDDKESDMDTENTGVDDNFWLTCYQELVEANKERRAAVHDSIKEFIDTYDRSDDQEVRDFITDLAEQFDLDNPYSRVYSVTIEVTATVELTVEATCDDESVEQMVYDNMSEVDWSSEIDSWYSSLSHSHDIEDCSVETVDTNMQIDVRES